MEFQKILMQTEKLQVRDDNILIKNLELWNKITSDLSVYGAYDPSDYVTERRGSYDLFVFYYFCYQKFAILIILFFGLTFFTVRSIISTSTSTSWEVNHHSLCKAANKIAIQ